jgi:hypothetical protein
MIVIRAQERKATLLGSNAPLRVDPIALATEVGQPLSSTDQLRAVFDAQAWSQASDNIRQICRMIFRESAPHRPERRLVETLACPWCGLEGFRTPQDGRFA